MTPRRPTLISYDMQSDWRRASLRLHLESRGGGWLQRSLWLLPSTAGPDVNDLVDEVLPLMEPNDRLLIHRPCLGCLADLRVHNGNEPPLEAEHLTV